VALVERAGEVVTKEELLQRVWPDTFVEEANLSVNVSALRKALGTREGDHAYIQTIPRRGYRFVVPPGEAAPRQTPRPAIAVLPFRDLSPSAGDEYLGVGTSVALISRLSRLSGIVVRPTSAILKYVDAPADPREAARELRVDAVVEGTVQRSGNRVRVTVHLVRVDEDGAAWSDSFEEEMTSLFAVQDAAAEQVARALDVELRGADRAVLARRDTADVAASQAYLKGRYFWSRFTGEWMGRAFSCYQEAVERTRCLTRASPTPTSSSAFPASCLRARPGPSPRSPRAPRCGWTRAWPTPTSRWATCGCSGTGTGRAHARP